MALFVAWKDSRLQNEKKNLYRFLMLTLTSLYLKQNLGIILRITVSIVEVVAEYYVPTVDLLLETFDRMRSLF